jgi:16S rRNA (cytosine1402-N4)-methyltransferase
MDQPTPHDNSYHQPVMVEEVLSWLEPASNSWIVDCTFGGGGHSRALLDRYPSVRIVGIDRDADALLQAPDDPRLVVVRANYADISRVLDDAGLPGRVSGILCDLGVSSHQLDTDERGFSYHRHGPLDMRMGPDVDRTAAEIINDSGEDELVSIFTRYGEEQSARRIARAIINQRPFFDTIDLATCIAESVPAARRRRGHPARKVFQALRIAVNDELAAVERLMDESVQRLAPGGRLVVMAYHSLEDRIVKRSLVKHATTCTCPPEIPVCVCGAEPEIRILTPKAIRPTSAEVERNPRSRSAVMRVGERI